jgi:hypothetical protein
VELELISKSVCGRDVLDPDQVVGYALGVNRDPERILLGSGRTDLYCFLAKIAAASGEARTDTKRKATHIRVALMINHASNRMHR